MKKIYIFPIVGTVLFVLYGIVVNFINANGYRFVGENQKLAPIIITIGFYVCPLVYVVYKKNSNIKSTMEDKIQVRQSYKMLEEQILELDDAQVLEPDDSQVIINYGEGYIATLRGISWLQLIIGCFVGIIILIQPSQSSSEQNVTTDAIKHLNGYMGLYLIISSISLFVFLTVISNIAENTVAIRMNSEKLVQKEIT